MRDGARTRRVDALRRLRHLLATAGIDPLQAVQALRALPAFLRDLRALRSQARSSAESFPFGAPHPWLSDRHDPVDAASGHYFHQDLLVARRVFQAGPVRHVDVGSRLDGLVAHLAAFREVEVLDIRAPASAIPNVTFTRADLMAPLDPALENRCDSLSCLHALEHFGLGRYGDPIRFDGHLEGLANLDRILQPGGRLYLSVPIGPQRIEFNAHRVFSVRYLLDHFEGRYRVERFSFVDDEGRLHEDVPLRDEDVAANFGCHYGCGILELAKAVTPASRAAPAPRRGAEGRDRPGSTPRGSGPR